MFFVMDGFVLEGFKLFKCPYLQQVPNDVFPEGIQFGYFYNYCEEEEWNDTGARSEATVCCQVSKTKNQSKFVNIAY